MLLAERKRWGPCERPYRPAFRMPASARAPAGGIVASPVSRLGSTEPEKKMGLRFSPLTPSSGTVGLALLSSGK